MKIRCLGLGGQEDRKGPCLLVCWCVGVLVCGCVGVLACWRVVGAVGVLCCMLCCMLWCVVTCCCDGVVVCG